jgi:hypothetical protein
MRTHAVVFVDGARDESTDGGEAVQRVKEQPLVLQRAPPRVDHRVRARQLGEGQQTAQDARVNQFVDLGVHILHAGIRQYDRGGI